MIVQKPDAVGLRGSLRLPALGCGEGLKEAGRSSVRGEAVERAEAARWPSSGHPVPPPPLPPGCKAVGRKLPFSGACSLACMRRGLTPASRTERGQRQRERLSVPKPRPHLSPPEQGSSPRIKSSKATPSPTAFIHPPGLPGPFGTHLLT